MGGFILIMVVIKLIAPRIDDTPDRSREQIVKYTKASACARFTASGV